MPRVEANGIEIEYEEEGDPGGPPLLLVNGLGGQLVGWSPEFRAALAARGFRLLRYDNRDVGLSTWLDDAGLPDIFGLARGATEHPPAYELADMADDAAALIEALGLDAAHVLGVSLGGMIVQMLTIRHPDRVLSLCSVMSTTGNRDVGSPRPDALQALLRPPPTGEEAIIEQSLDTSRVISSPDYPFDEERERARITLAHERAYHPAGVARQLAVVVTAPDRTAALGSVEVPTLVVHGAADPLISVSGGEATAKAIPGAKLLVLEGMGHDVPPALADTIADAVLANAGEAGGGVRARA